MITRLQKIRLGIFFTVSVILLLVLVALILTPRFLEKKDVYYIGYRDLSLTGLQVGGAVKYHGLTVGNVSDIRIDMEDIRRVIVEVSLDRETPIKTDTYADITMLGITGLKVVEIRGGSNEAEFLEPGGFILPGKSVTEMITGKAEVIAEKAEMALNNLSLLTGESNQEKVMRLIDNTSQAMEELHTILSQNRSNFSETMANAEQASERILDLTVSTEQMVTDINTLVRSDSVVQILGNLADFSRALSNTDLVSLVESMNGALLHTNRVLRELDASLTKSQTDLAYSVESMKEVIDYLNEFSRLISEDPSILIRGARPENIPDYELEK
jgi:phospholipid/cholesterol/gamma-HCH transport system substrate-binding protein